MLFVALVLAACSGEDRDAVPAAGTSACSIDAQKQYVLDRMRDVYFWSDLLPASVNLAAYPTPEVLLEYLVSFQPLDGFSYIDLAVTDSQFFAAGQYRGFGFSTRFEAEGDLRITRVFASGPAAAAGFARGQRLVRVNGRTIGQIEANEGIDAVLSLPLLEFTIERTDASEFTVTVEHGTVTINPLPQYRIINRPDGTAVGYLELATFISTADAAFVDAFAAFHAAGVSDLILDLRYNGGGLVSTAELLGDYLSGGVADGTVFSRTLFNSRNAAANRTELFELRAQSVNLSRLVVIATRETASASELVTNSIEPHADVWIVGSTTLGKPVGQLGLEFCGKILRPTAFETVNSLDQGRYFDGLPADCASRDELTIPVGDDGDPNLIAALGLLDTGACSTAGAPVMQQKPLSSQTAAPRRAEPWRQFAGAW